MYLVQEKNPECPFVLIMKDLAGASQQISLMETVFLKLFIFMPLVDNSNTSKIKSLRNSLL